ncbi:phage head closure protein [Devosia sp. SL43]|uniref:phage head closure protein n=1 Tax=Devosia sp. SL43 TaxID=2806348 RepID=UPI001F01D859|nr:phage head closure protein [Devosia sp. SL43]UJW87965.1 phage head closure protein [Devosia sp. SL43]
MALKSEKLDRRITLMQYGITYNADNEPIEGFTPLATVWASATPVSDGEKVRAAEVGASISMRFQIRYSATVAVLNPKDCLVYQDKIHDISGVKELGRREGLEITAAAAADE